jgi:hypothetical protein
MKKNRVVRYPEPNADGKSRCTNHHSIVNPTIAELIMLTDLEVRNGDEGII